MSSNFVVEATDDGSPVRIPRTFGTYKYVRTLGTGSTSVVCLVEESKSKTLFAAKVVERSFIVRFRRLEYLERELRVMGTLQHPYIVRLVDVFYLDEVIIMIMDYCEHGDLLSFVYQNGTPSLPQLRTILFQLVSALDYLHSRGLAHRDLKPENLLVDSNCDVKVADLGLAKENQKDAMMQTVCGTMYYTAPEVLAERDYDGCRADIWSIGVIASLLAHGALPWTSEDEVGIKRDIINGDVRLSDDLPDMVHSFITACLQMNPEDRATTKDLLKMPLIRDVGKMMKTVRLKQVVAQPRGSQPKIMKGTPSVRRIYVRPIRTVQSQRLAPGRYFTDLAKPKKENAISITPSLRLPRRPM